MQYKIVFCDIDGTLIDSKHRVSAGTKQKIQQLHRIGIPFVLVSARMPSGIFPIRRELALQSPIICYSGALILDKSGDCVMSACISSELASAVDSFISKEFKNVCSSAFFHNKWMVSDASNAWVVQEQRITSSVPSEGKLSCLAAPEGHVHKFLCMGEAGQIADLTLAVSEKYPELSVYRSKDTYLEIMDGAVSKSNAVRFLCSDYAISIDAAVSFGDNYNDVDMLLATGVGFAMGNAPEEVKRQVGNVTLSNDDEGVLAGLQQLSFFGNSSNDL